jgi:hypothetical protein
MLLKNHLQTQFNESSLVMSRAKIKFHSKPSIFDLERNNCNQSVYETSIN